MSDRVFGGCGIVGIRVAGSERDVEPDVGTDFSNFVSVIPDRVAVFYFVLDTSPRQNTNKICFCTRLIRIFVIRRTGVDPFGDILTIRGRSVALSVTHFRKIYDLQ